MKFSANKKACLDLVNCSPQAVREKDRAAWLGLFAQFNVVEDPVGSRPHIGGLFDARSGKRGSQALARFYDTFIAPNDIVFDVEQDVVCLNRVVRDLTIKIHMSPVVVAEVPMHLLYELTEEQGDLKIRRLAAHWEAWPMVKSLLAYGTTAWPVLTALSIRMIRLQGLYGALGFSKGFFSIGKRGKSAVRNIEKAVNERNKKLLVEQFEMDRECIEFPAASKPIKPAEFLDAFTNNRLSFSKLLASGATVTATLEVIDGDSRDKGVAIFDFNAKTSQVERLQFYCQVIAIA